MKSIDLEFQITPAGFQSVRRKFASEGVVVPDATNGELEQSGVKARFTYDGRLLRVSVYDKPWAYPSGIVKSRLAEFIQSAIL